MSNVIPLRPHATWATLHEAMRRGVVASVADGSADVELSDGSRITAAIATRDVEVGDAAIVASVEGALYVLGAVPVAPRESAALRCERDPASGRHVVRFPKGPVEIQAHGDVTWTSAGAMRVEAADEVTLCAGPEAATEAAVTVGAARVRLHAPAVDVDAGAFEVAARRASIAAEAVTITADVLRRALGTLETDVDRVIERAQSSIRETKDLALTRAGRVRTVVERTASLLAHRFVVKSEDDVKIDASRIHLG